MSHRRTTICLDDCFIHEFANRFTASTYWVTDPDHQLCIARSIFADHHVREGVDVVFKTTSMPASWIASSHRF